MGVTRGKLLFVPPINLRADGLTQLDTANDSMPAFLGSPRPTWQQMRPRYHGNLPLDKASSLPPACPALVLHQPLDSSN